MPPSKGSSGMFSARLHSALHFPHCPAKGLPSDTVPGIRLRPMDRAEFPGRNGIPESSGKRMPQTRFIREVSCIRLLDRLSRIEDRHPSATVRASSRSWVIKSTPAPSSASSLKCPRIRAAARASSPGVGSSAMISLGFSITAGGDQDSARHPAGELEGIEFLRIFPQSVPSERLPALFLRLCIVSFLSELRSPPS